MPTSTEGIRGTARLTKLLCRDTKFSVSVFVDILLRAKGRGMVLTVLALNGAQPSELTCLFGSGGEHPLPGKSAV